MFLQKNLGFFSQLPILYFQKVTVIPTIIYKNDPYLNYVVLNINGDNSLSGNNNIFLDSSNSGITNISTTTQGVFSPFSPAGWSGYFNGSSSLTIPNNSVLQFGNSQFTIEFWFNPAINNANYDIMGKWGSEWIIQYRTDISGGRGFRFTYNSTVARNFSYTTLSANVWTHFALTKDSSNNYRLFINGTQVGANQTDANTITNGSNTNLTIGNVVTGYTGYISNLRILKGTALYTSNFTPNSAEPLKLLQNTSLLTLQNNRFVDNSRYNHTISVGTGVPRIQPFSPISPSIDYTPSLHGGSAYFDGNTYLSIPDNPGWDIGGRGTIEFWFYLTGDSATNQSQVKDAVLFAQANNYTFNIRGDATKTGTKLEFVVPSLITLTYIADIIKYVWHHVALVTNGSNITMYYNGVNVASAAYTSTTNFINPLILGGLINVGFYPNRYIGYISNFRIVRGQAVYTSNFTPPTRLLTDTSNGGASVSTTAVPDLSVKPALLLNFDNGGIIDRSYKNNITVVGDVKTQPLSSKFGAGSLVFDGTGDYLTALQSDNLNLSSCDFTVEAWVYSNTIATGVSYIISRSALTISTTSDAQFLIFRDAATLKVKPYSGTTDYTINLGTIVANTWYHIALVRSGNTFYGYLNGVRNTTAQTITGALNNNSAWNGVIIGGASTNSWNGLIEDVRITKGIARYTAATEIIPTKSQANNTDPFYSNVVLFLNGNSIGSDSNNVFRGNAGNGASLTITRTNATQGSFSPFSLNGWSGFFSSTRISVPAGTNFAYGTNNFTIEAWVFLRSYSSSSSLIFSKATSGQNYFNIGISSSGLLYFTFGDGAGTTIISNSVICSLNRWHHVAVSRTGTGTDQTILYVDGIAVGTGTCSYNFTNTTYNPTIGGYTHTGGTLDFNGHISNLRVIKGLALYTSNFKLPIEPLPALSGSGFNTSLLTLQNNRLIDNSPNNYSFTSVAGTVSIQAFNPFKQTTAYSPTLHGASGYFDGTSYLLVTSNLTNFYISTGITTVECYVYKIGTEKDIIISQTQNTTPPYAGWIFYIDNQTLKVETGINVTVSSNILVPLNQWVHVAFVRENNNITLYINGINAGSGTLSITNFNGNLAIGSYTSTVAANNFNGYISNLRMVRGLNVYKSNFKPPTEPLTSINGTVLLLKFDNGYAIDSTGNNVITTVGDSRTDVLSTAPLSSSTGCLYFNGNSNLSIPSNVNLELDNSSFTIEWWEYISTNINSGIISRSGTGGLNGGPWLILGKNNGNIEFYAHNGDGGSWNISNGTILGTRTLNQWTHWALVRDGNIFKAYKNGVDTGIILSSSDSFASSTNPMIIGQWDGYLNGYIDDLRITKGVARYTSNFTPQTYKNPISDILIYPTDPFKNYVVLDLNADAVNNEQNNTFLDRSGNNITFTKSGSATQGSFSPFSPAGWSGYFDGNTKLTINNFTLSNTLDFTIEFWAYHSMIPSGTSNICYIEFIGTVEAHRFIFGRTNNGIRWYINQTESGFAYAGGISEWTHYAITYIAGNFNIYINGVLSSQTSHTTWSTQTLYIGRNRDNFEAFTGYISNLRVVKGQAIYTNNFTPPTAALTTTSTVSGITLSAENVLLLTLQDNCLKDNSNNNLTINVAGTPSVKPFSPFQSIATYSPTVHGGSGYFNGVGSTTYLISTGNNVFNFGSSDWTVEAWVYLNAMPTSDTWSPNWNLHMVVAGVGTSPQGDGFDCIIGQTKLSIQSNDTQYSGTAHGLIINTWNHLAYVRNGNNIFFYVNGVPKGSVAFTGSVGGGSNTYVGCETNDGAGLNGYISNLRVVKGVAIIPPIGGPTAPVQAVSGTSLLLNFDNAGVVDNSGKNTVTTFNTSKVDYTNEVYGSGALRFNGTNDYIQVGIASDWTFLHTSNTKWTIEFWIYSNSSTINTIVDTNGSTLGARGISLQKLANNTIDIFITNGTAGNFVARATTTAVIPLSTWTHVAITYNHSLTANNLVIYLNGSQSIFSTKTAQTPSTTNPANTLTIGAFGNGGGQFFNGFIDELRITNAVRYTSNFSVSSYTQPLLI